MKACQLRTPGKIYQNRSSTSHRFNDNQNDSDSSFSVQAFSVGEQSQNRPKFFQSSVDKEPSRVIQAEKLLTIASDEKVGYDLRQALIQRIAKPSIEDEAAEFDRLVILM